MPLAPGCEGVSGARRAAPRKGIERSERQRGAARSKRAGSAVHLSDALALLLLARDLRMGFFSVKCSRAPPSRASRDVAGSTFGRSPGSLG
jgi:hypothetical protein